MDTHFKKILIEKCQIDLKKPVILGISGGVDSSCLLHLFSKMDIPFIIAHFHHGLRISADDDAQFVEMIAKKYQLPYEIGYGKVRDFADINGLSIEEAARNCRYQFLFEIAEKYSAQSIAVAHNADDQVETVLMHLLRGSGLSGLKGMKYSTIIRSFHPTISIIRPLINIWRSEIESYIILNELDYCKDPTNADTKYNRNKIRHEIIPFLEKSYPNLKDRIWNMAEVLSSDEEIIEKQLSEIFIRICQMPSPNLICCDTEKFLETHVGFQRRLLRKAVFSINDEVRDVSYQVIDRAIKFIKENFSGKIDLINNLILETTDTKFYIFPRGINWCEAYFPQMGINEEICIHAIGDYKFGNNWILKVEILDHRDAIEYQSEDEYSGWIDFDQIGGFPIYLGTRKNGDQFKPLGMDKGSIKINKIFINEKLAKAAREQWPLLRTLTKELVWIPGFRPSDTFKISDNTKLILKLKLEKNS